MPDLNRIWYEGRWYQWFLWPLSLLFAGVSGIRRFVFRLGLKKTIKLPVPVIIVGNLSVGGNGKTPLVIALCEYFTKAGYKVGVVSRGYGSNAAAYPHQVCYDDKASIAGDEPLLIARRTGVPVVIDPVRPRAAQQLIEQKCDIIISDDGLQHYALGRDIECVVADRRLFGNGHLLPMGPLREGLWRLKSVDFIILNQPEDIVQLPAEAANHQPVGMALQPGKMVNLLNPQFQRSVRDFDSEQRITAMAGIGDPARFFKQLTDLGFNLDKCLALADHHAIEKQDIPTDCVIMTEKDAVKAVEFAHENCWYQPVDAVLPDAFYNQLMQQINRCR